MTPLSWPIFLALMAGFGGDAAALYRLRRNNTPLARVIMAFSLLTLAVLLVYAFAINPYRQRPLITDGFLGAAIFLFAIGLAFAKFIPNTPRRILSPEMIQALLPGSVTELTQAEMRTLVPAGLRRHADHELRAMVLMYLSRSSPGTIRSLTPKRLQLLLKREIPHSILNS